MIKKMLVLGGGAALVGLVLVGRDAYSYLRTSAGYVTDAVQESVPIEFQIDRARGMVQDLVPEVRKNMHIIAKEEVEVQRLDEQIAQSESQLGKEKDQLLRLKADAASGQSAFQYAGRSYTLEEVRTDLAHRFERYKTSEATLASLKEIRNARQKSLVAARQKLEGMLASQAAVAGRGGESRSPLADDRRRQGHEQLPVRRQPAGARQGVGVELAHAAGSGREAGQCRGLLPRRDSVGQGRAREHRRASHRALRRQGAGGEVVAKK